MPELRHRKRWRVGRRGEGWVLLQFALLAAIGVAAHLPGPWPSSLGRAALAVGIVVALVGTVLLGAGFRGLGRGLTPFPQPRPGAHLVTRGVYGHVRHPIYAGLILIALGWSLAYTSVWALALCLPLAVLLELKSRREEAFLSAHMAGYAAYRARVRRRFLPGLY
jgi:protein-S-isoprenylcysteine O-methyltransferase Ste14